MESLQGEVTGRLIRGGTSKGFFVRESALPDNGDDLLDTLVLELFGTPDPLQVDGIGGSHSHTSKLMVVRPADREGVDISYTFGQVGVEKPVVGWSGNCGNLTSAIGVFAIKEGLVDTEGSTATVTLYNTNTDTVVEQTIPLAGGDPDVYGEYRIDGIPGTGARVDSTFLDPAGTTFDSPLPTGNAIDTVVVDDESYEVSVIDVTNPCAFVRAADVGLTGTELPAALSETPGLLERLERIRGAVCERLGLVDDPAEAATEQPTTPYIAVVSPPAAYECSVDRSIAVNAIDITSRILTTQTPHHAYAMTGAMCLGAGSRLSGTIPNETARPVEDRVRIGHPKGRISVGVETDDMTVRSVTVSRTTREIMSGTAYYRFVDGLERLRR